MIAFIIILKLASGEYVPPMNALLFPSMQECIAYREEKTEWLRNQEPVKNGTIMDAQLGCIETKFMGNNGTKS